MSDFTGEDAFRLLLSELIDAKNGERSAELDASRFRDEKRAIGKEADEIAARCNRAEAKLKTNEHDCGLLWDAAEEYRKLVAEDGTIPARLMAVHRRLTEALKAAEVACGKIPF